MITVRPARLDDTRAISALFRAWISVWQRLTLRGQVETVSYDDLSLYERWSHGSATHSGAWMSLETAAIHLSRLLRGAGLAYVAEAQGQVIGYAEVYAGDEPTPFGRHLHLAHLITVPPSSEQGSRDEVLDAVLKYLLTLARQTDSGHLTVSLTPNDEAAVLYQDYILKPLTVVQRYTLSTRSGQGFYKINDSPGSSAAQIDGWAMPVGRTESSTQHWELLWTRVWDILPEIEARKTHRLYLSASGHEAFVCCQQHLYTPRHAEIFCWSPKTLTTQLLTALRDWAHRQEYRTLALVVTPEVAKVLGSDAEADPYTRQLYAIQPPI